MVNVGANPCVRPLGLGYPNANFANGANNRLCHSEHREESRPEKDKKEIHRFALNDRRNALNDKGGALNDPPCHPEHREESHLEKERDSSLRL